MYQHSTANTISNSDKQQRQGAQGQQHSCSHSISGNRTHDSNNPGHGRCGRFGSFRNAQSHHRHEYQHKKAHWPTSSSHGDDTDGAAAVTLQPHSMRTPAATLQQ